MRTYIFLSAIILGSFVLAAANTNTSTLVLPTAKVVPKVNKSQTEMNFEDLLVSGQYHFSDEAVTTVEEDKVLNSLIGVRTDFKDRIKQSATLGEVKK